MKSWFSRRHGFGDYPKPQIDTLNEPVRRVLYTVFELAWISPLEDPRSRPKAMEKMRSIWLDFFDGYLDQAPTEGFEAKKFFRSYFEGEPMNRVFDLMEASIEQKGDDWKQLLSKGYNSMLEKHNVAYRVVDGLVTPLTDDPQLAALGEVFELRDEYSAKARQHLHLALEKLSDREEPDYAGCVRESIHAVESLVRKLTGTDKFSTALAELEKQNVHPSLRSAFDKLYGYASDEDGVRHSMIGDRTVGFAEANYMVVACSTFVTYLVVKHTEAR